MALLTVRADEAALARAAADRITSLIARAVASRGSAVVCLTGGSTPRELYRLLGSHDEAWRSRIDWTRLHLFWGDERHVPPDHADSNFGMAHAALLQHVPIPESQVHRMRGELREARDAAREYETTLRDGFAAAGRTGRRFDAMLLGLGTDAHIASIFPDSPLLENWTPEVPDQRSPDAPHVAAVPGPEPDTWRITLTPGAVIDADVILMLVAGAAKADAVRATLDAEYDVRQRPAQLLRAEGDRVEWFMDRAAAGRSG